MYNTSKPSLRTEILASAIAAEVRNDEPETAQHVALCAFLRHLRSWILWTAQEEAEEWTGRQTHYEDGLAYGWRLLCEWAGSEAPLTALTACMRLDEADRHADGNGRFLECGYNLAVKRHLLVTRPDYCEAHFARANNTRQALLRALRTDASMTQEDLFQPASAPDLSAEFSDASMLARERPERLRALIV